MIQLDLMSADLLSFNFCQCFNLLAVGTQHQAQEPNAADSNSCKQC